MKFSVGTDYRVPTVVRHQGMVIVLALDENRGIYYRVLALDPAQPDDDKSWSDRKKLGFPDQIRPSGMSLVTVDLKTAERTADVPFQAVSDGKQVYLFRQSTGGTLYVDRFVFDPASKILNPTWEARFQRSRKRDIPASRKDTLGARDMEGEPFFEPTTELTVVNDLQDGRFCVLLLPGRLPSEWRWQIFVTNSDGEIDSFSIGRGEDGLFDMADVQRSRFKWADTGRRFQTGPGALLYMQQEDAQDEYGRPQRVKRGARVMLAAPVGSSRHALELDGVDDYVSLGKPDSLQIKGEVTIEAWVKPQTGKGLQNIVAHGAGGVYLRIKGGQYQIGVGDGSASYAMPQEDTDTWIHLAGAYDSERKVWLLFRNGIQVAQAPVAGEADPTGAVTDTEDWIIGRSFAGQINNVRLWNVARTEGEIVQDMHRRLAGDEPGLVGDWPIDEGSGDRVYDRVHHNHGQLRSGLALELDGVDDYVELPHLNPDYASGFTVEAWVRYRSFRRWSRIIDFGSGPSQDNIVFANRGTTNDLVFQVYRDGAWNIITAPGALETGTWMHLAATVDGDGNAALYKNGQLLVTGTVHVPATLNRTQNYIGRSNWAQDGYFDGGMRQVRVWNIARSPDDIQATMNQRLRGDESGLVGDWPFDEGLGVTIHDRAADHHGQLYVSCGNALDLDGVDDYVSIPPINLSAYDTMSIEAWVKPGDIGTNRYCEIIRQDAQPKPDWLLAFQEHGEILSFGLAAGDSYQELDVTIEPTDYADGQWHHIAATYDGQIQRLYRDGCEIDSMPRTGTIRFSPNAIHSIGSRKGKSEFFDGQIGPVCLWTVARTPQDIQRYVQLPDRG